MVIYLAPQFQITFVIVLIVKERGNDQTCLSQMNSLDSSCLLSRGATITKCVPFLFSNYALHPLYHTATLDTRREPHATSDGEP